MNIPKKHLRHRANKNNNYATINKSMLNGVNLPNLYRFFCLSLYRNDYYKVRLRIQDIAASTGEKETALKNFNKDIEKVLTRKRYPVPINHPVYEYAMRSIYAIPPMDYPDFITLSRQLTKEDLSVKAKGYYIKLLLIAEDNVVALTPKAIAAKLGMGKATVESYNIDLYQVGLLKFISNGLELTPKELLLSNDIAQQCKVWVTQDKNSPLNITFMSK